MNTPIHPPDPFDAFVTRDSVLLRSMARLRSWAQSPLGVLLTGEAGVGKSLVARLLHLASASPSSAYLVCTAAEPTIPANPWATLDEGGGTVVLEGLEHWSLELQAAMAHRLAARTGAPVRAVATSRLTDVRLRNENRLHPALSQHWASRVIDIAPLRARPDDLAPLVDGMLRRAGRGSVELDPAAWHALASHGWSDNVRELRRAIDDALAQAVTERIEPWHLALDRLVPPSLDALAGQPFQAMRREVDTWYLRRLLHETGDNLSEAARRSGCSRKVLRERLRRYGLYRAGRMADHPAKEVSPSLASGAVAPPAVPVGVLAAEERVVPWVVARRDRPGHKHLTLVTEASPTGRAAA